MTPCHPTREGIHLACSPADGSRTRTSQTRKGSPVGDAFRYRRRPLMSPRKNLLIRFGDVILRSPITVMGSRRVRLMAAALLLALLPVAPPATATTSVGPRTFYLALGDSLAWGYQPNWNIVQGYAEDLYLHLLRQGTFSHLPPRGGSSPPPPPRGTFFEVNMAFSGKTASTFIAGGCPFALYKKYPYGGP